MDLSSKYCHLSLVKIHKKMEKIVKKCLTNGIPGVIVCKLSDEGRERPEDSKQHNKKV